MQHTQINTKNVVFFHADSDYVGPLKTTYQPQDQNALPGDSTRFFCEAFIGT
jgi:hypothetical protein